METPFILVVDDEESQIEFLTPLLKRCGFSVSTASNGKEALLLILKNSPDLIVSDVIMPEMDGRELLRELRRRNIWIPVLLLTQVNESYEKAIALDEGADDYLDKPFDPYELVARIKAVLRRANPGEPSLVTSWMLKAGEIVFDRKKRQVFYKGETIQLTHKALGLLEFLMTHPDEVLSHKRLLKMVWNWDYVPETRTVSNRVAEIRRVLQDDALHPTYIETIPGQGYRFIAVVESVG